MESSGGKKSVTLIDGRGEHFLFSPPRDNTGSRKKKNINNLQTTFGREIAKHSKGAVSHIWINKRQAWDYNSKPLCTYNGLLQL